MSQFSQQYGPQILARTTEHLWISLLAVAFAVAVGLPAGVWSARDTRFCAPMSRFIRFFQTIPSLALFGCLLPIFGVGTFNSLVATTLFLLSPIVRNTFDGLSGVDADVREAALALGMTRDQIFRRVELPLAADGIVAGVREAVVLSIGLTAIGGFFGAGGLGELIREGLRAGDNAMVLAGAISAALLAFGIDWGLGIWQKTLARRQRGNVEVARVIGK